MPRPSGERPLRPHRFVLAAAVSASLVLSAPFIGEFRHWLRDRFPGHFVAIVASGVALAALAAVAFAVRRIRDHRLVRYGLIAAALLLAAVYSRASAIGNPESDVVERVHFLEYGLITWLFYRAWRPLNDAAVLVLPILAGLIVGTCEEWFQWFIPARVGELRDIFLNLAAIVFGLLFSVAVEPPGRLSRGLPRRSRAQVCVVAATATTLLAAFVWCAHLGYEIVDREIGSFRSIYSAGELARLSADRAREWSVDPPLARPPRLSREDQYASEGLLHVQERNRRWDAQEFGAAWRENLILEKYFAPVLDAPSYLTRSGHRWPSEQRADAQRRLQAEPAGAFVSRAQGSFPIFTWSRRAYAATMFAVVLLLLVPLAIVPRRPPVL